MIDKRKKAIDAFRNFISEFIRDLNHLSGEGWAILVEGQRDESALRRLGFSGCIATISSLRRKGVAAFCGSKNVILLTDLDREGAVLTSRYLKELSHEGLHISLAERRRFKHASRGLFLHVENLSRFDDSTSVHQDW